MKGAGLSHSTKILSAVLSENLATLLDTQQIEKYPWSLRTKVDYQIEINVQRFETTSDGQTQLIASWIIRDGRAAKSSTPPRLRPARPRVPMELAPRQR